MGRGCEKGPGLCYLESFWFFFFCGKISLSTEENSACHWNMYSLLKDFYVSGRGEFGVRLIWDIERIIIFNFSACSSEYIYW